MAKSKYEDMSSADKSAFLHARVREIAAAIGDSALLKGFVYDTVKGRREDGRIDTWAYLTHTDGRSLCFQLDVYRSRLVIDDSIRWYDSKRNESITPRRDLPKTVITVDPERAADKIVREIERRVMPAFAVRWAYLQEQLQSGEDETSAQNHALSVLKAAGFDVRSQNTQRGHYGYFHSHGGQFEIAYGGKVRIKLDISLAPDKAAALMRAIAPLLKGEE